MSSGDLENDCFDDEAADFSPDEPDDGRNQGEWRSRYCDSVARRAIRDECAYLVVIFFFVPVVSFIAWLGLPQQYWNLSDVEFQNLSTIVMLSMGGLLGGILFSMKWLYHSVAKGKWNEDRRLWRVLTPLISSALACSVGLVIKSGIFGVFDPNSMNDSTKAFAIGFLVGYFSDSALAKMAEVAKSMFGVVEHHR